MKHYLFINQYVTQLYVDILNVFVREGHAVTLLTGDVMTSGESLSESVEVVYLTPYRRNRAITRVATWLRFARQALRYVRTKGGHVELVLSTNPPLLIPFLANLEEVAQLRYHLIIYDLYPDALFNHWSGRNGWLSNWWSSHNRIVMRGASSLITIGDTMKEALAKYLEEPSDGKVQMVPCWADYRDMKPASETKNPFEEEHGLLGKFVVLYSGNLGSTHDFDTLLLAARELRQHPNIQFVIIGDGVRKASIMRKLRQFSLANVTLLPFQDQQVLPYSFNVGDVGVVTQGEGAELFSVPSKTYYYMAAGSAILGIAGEGSELEQITERFHNGKIFRHGAWREVADFILQLYDQPQELQSFQRKSLEAATHFTPDNAKSIYRIITGSEN